MLGHAGDHVRLVNATPSFDSSVRGIDVQRRETGSNAVMTFTVLRGAITLVAERRRLSAILHVAKRFNLDTSTKGKQTPRAVC